MATYSSATIATAVLVTRAGVNITTLPVSPTATHGNKFLYSPNVFLVINNGSGGDITMTVDTPGTIDAQVVADRTITLTAGKKYFIGPFSDAYIQSDNYIWVYFSAVTTLTMGVYSLG